MITSEIIKQLKIAGITPNKTLGQNFLINERIYEKIVTAVGTNPSDVIVEVGPGLGTLTDYLLTTEAKIIAVEKDKKMVEFLTNKFKNNKNVDVVYGDILKFNPVDYNLHNLNYKITGNIPYYLTSHLVRTVFSGWPKPKIIVFMLQKEVALRMIAKPPQMSLLSVSVQYYSKPEIVSHVSRGNFYPMPKVDSSIIKLNPTGSETSPEKEKKFFQIAKIGFSSKRKQLLNNLSSGLNVSKEAIAEKLTSAGIAPQRRAETLTINEWGKLAEILDF